MSRPTTAAGPLAVSEPATPECPFCQGRCKYVYDMGDYPIWRCRNCGTGQTFPRPDAATLAAFYRGFLFAARPENYGLVVEGAGRLFATAGLEPTGSGRMLDVGGGGGFYARAFQELGFGRGTYIDLDPGACHFARRSGIERVIQGPVEDLEDSAERYDLVFCRHVLEHLVEPTEVLDLLARRLRHGGCLLVVVPNGASLEYLAHPFSNLASRLAVVLRSNRWGIVKVLSMLCGRNLLHGMDPPRHLWAITPRGLESFLRPRDVSFWMASYPLDDPVFSPFVRSRAVMAPFLWTGRWLARIRGGTHLVVWLEVPDADSRRSHP